MRGILFLEISSLCRYNCGLFLGLVHGQVRGRDTCLCHVQLDGGRHDGRCEGDLGRGLVLNNVALDGHHGDYQACEILGGVLPVHFLV